MADALQTALPVLQNIPSPLSHQDVHNIVASSLAPSLSQAHVLSTKVNALDTTITSNLPRLCDLYSVCFGGVANKPAEALAARLNALSTRLLILDNHVARSSSSFGLGNIAPPPLSSPSTSALGVVQTQISQLFSLQKELQACIGQDVMEIGGVKFESLPQTITWVNSQLSSESYHVFMDMNTLLDALGSSHLSDKDSIDERYHAQKGRFENESAARVVASFGRELPTIFVKMETSTSTTTSSPLPAVKSYAALNAPETHSGVKQRTLNEINNSFNSITSDISSCLSGRPVALMVANTFLLNSKAAIDSMLTWMESFPQELKAGGQSDASEAWFLVCSCIRGYFKELRKVRAPTQVASNMSSVTDRAGTYLWAMVQSHRITQDFISHRWREHSSITGVINYHLFRFMMLLSTHNRLKEEVAVLKKTS